MAQLNAIEAMRSCTPTTTPQHLPAPSSTPTDECAFTCTIFEAFRNSSWSVAGRWMQIHRNRVDADFGPVNMPEDPQASQHGGSRLVRWSQGLPDYGVGSRKWMKKYRTEIASSTASVAGTFCAYPLDSLKTRMQAYPQQGNFIATLKETYKHENMRGFWRGISAPLASIAFNRTLMFSTYQKAKYAYSARIQEVTGGTAPLVHVNHPGSFPNFGTVTCFGAAGATAGAVAATIGCPFELTGKGAQISVLVGKKNSPGTSVTDPLNPRAKSRHAKGTFTVTKDIVKSIGIRGLYTGYHLHLVRDTLGTSIYFMCYESSKQILATYQGSTPTSPIPVAIAGGLCGVVSLVCTYPIDSAKTIYQRSVMSQLKVAVPDKKSPEKVKITYFDKSMYAGSSVSIARSFILNSILFSTFEGIKKVINEMEP